MSKPDLLIDQVYRASFKPRGVQFVNYPDRLQHHLRNAHRFVLDEKMSAFLVDLAAAAYLGKRYQPEVVGRLVDQLRVQARLPYERVWIEHDFVAVSKRMRELGLTTHWHYSYDPNEQPRTPRQGWLLNRHPANEALFRVHVFEDLKEIGPMAGPVAFAWHTDDAPAHASWAVRAGGSSKSEELTGIAGYRNDRCGIVYSEYADDADDDWNHDVLTDYRRIQTATLRRIWALLATINDLPIGKRHAAASKGFVARGRHRRYLDHSIVTLQVPPTADLRKIARHAVAASRRRAHSVRGHWRVDWHRPLARSCEHEFDAAGAKPAASMVCRRCGGHKTWIAEHQRGDASLGFVTHDYAVTHPERRTTAQ